MIPSFESPFLSEFGEAIQRRQKAIKHSTFGLECVRVIDERARPPEEKLELIIAGPRRFSHCLRANAWPDRWMWIDAREPGKRGWKWQWTREGRLLGNCTGANLVEALELSYAASPFVSEKAFTDQVAAIWRPLLATGPRLAVWN